MVPKLTEFIGWKTEFDDPIPLPDGRELRTLRDAADYIAALPAVEAETDRWQLAIENLINAADHNGIVMVARIAMLRALDHDPRSPTGFGRKTRSGSGNGGNGK